MDQETLVVAACIALASLLYATAGQAGGTAFLAVMAFAGFPASSMRPTALLLNVVAAGYATWRLHRLNLIDWSLLMPITLPSLVTAFAGGLVVLHGRAESFAKKRGVQAVHVSLSHTSEYGAASAVIVG